MASDCTLLGLDTAGSSCAVALWRDGAVCASRLEKMRRGQSERLMPMISEVMAEAGLAFDDLDGLAVTTGPGGFTGVRIGLAAARGLALACGKPLVGVNNFEVLARAVPQEERSGERQVLVLIDAKRADLFAQGFAVTEGGFSPVTEPLAIAPEDLDGALPTGPLLLCGDAVDQAEDALRDAGRDLAISSAEAITDAANLVRLVVERRLLEQEAPLPQPLYLRPPDVSLPKKKL